jgi:hypothetical protein
LLIVWDRLPGHRSRLVQDYIANLQGWIFTAYLPPRHPHFHLHRRHKPLHSANHSMEISYAAFGQRDRMEFAVECSSHLKPFQAKCAWEALEGLVTIRRHLVRKSSSDEIRVCWEYSGQAASGS